MPSSTHYYGGPRDPLRLAMFEPFDLILCGKFTSAETIAMLQAQFPDKLIGTYLATTFELSAEEEKSYPGKMSNRTTSVGRVVGEMNEATVQWQAKRAADAIHSAGLLVSDNSDPKQPIGDPRLYNAADIANWREWVPKTMAAIKEAIGEALLVANVGHTCNPMSTGDPLLRACYQAFCGSVNGIGIEKKTGSFLANYTPASFQGPYLSPRASIAFAQDKAAYEATDAMPLPQYVYKSCVKWVVVAEWGV